MVLRFTLLKPFRQAPQFSQEEHPFSTLGGARKLYMAVTAGKCKWEPPRDASSTVEETMREEAGILQGKEQLLFVTTATLLFCRSWGALWGGIETRKFPKSSFCFIGNKLGFSWVGRTHKIPQL